MHYTIELLIHGDPNILDFYRKAVCHWKEIWSRPEASDLVSLAELLTNEQMWFEHNCGTHRVGQEIMVVSGFGMLYTTGAGFDRNIERARFLYDAFQFSYCSIEVKALSRDVAMSYDLLEQPAA
jgi:hypothetical protein